MRKIVQYVTIALICGALCVPAADARGRNNSNERDRRTEKTTGHKRGSTTASSRKNDRKDRDGHKARPGASHDKHHGTSRPGQAGNKPSHDNKNHRPGHVDNRHHTTPARPPQHGHNTPPPQHRPGPGVHHVHHGRPPRPFMPAHRPYRRPTPPPPAWRPARWSPLRSVLGVAFGTALGMSINYLVNGGYDVSGYDNEMVYLSNVPMLNYTWPVANLYYATGGGLRGSQFVYYTARRDMKRYNAVYRDLVRSYGNPYSVQNLAGGGRMATWWGTDGQYITLNCGTDIAGNGASHFYTTLSFGL